MLSDLKQLDKIDFFSPHYLTPEIGEEAVLYCINILKGQYILRYIEKLGINNQIIEDLSQLDGILQIQHSESDVFNLISILKNMVREESKGARCLDQIWMPMSDVETIKEDHKISDAKALSIFGIQILGYPSYADKKSSVFVGVCKNKFGYDPYDKMFLLTHGDV